MEFSRVGQVRYDQVRKVLSPGINLASRRQLYKLTKTYPKKESFLNGRWIKLQYVVPETIGEILEVENFEPQNPQTLDAYATINYDGAGTYAQIQGKTIAIDTTKNIQGKKICLNLNLR